MNDLRLRRFAPLLLIALGALLYLPGLNTFGLWDPSEIKVADAARNLLGHDWWKWASRSGRPPAVLWLVATGFEKLGASELSGRLPVALVSIATLLAVYYAGRTLVSMRAALIGALALTVTPSFVLGARQLTTNAPLLFASALALGGLARAAWPERPGGGVFRLLHLAVGLFGLALGQLSGGVLVGALAPLLTITVATAAAGGAIGVSLLGGLLSAALLVSGMVAAAQRNGFSLLLGGVPHPITHAVVFTAVAKQAVLAYFPWVVFVPYAGALVLSEELTVIGEGARARFSRILLFSSLIVLYLAATLQSVVSSELLVPMGPAVVLLFAAALDGLWSSKERRPYVGLLIAAGAFILGRDYKLFPELYLGAHSVEAIRVPALLHTIDQVLLAYALLFGVFMGLAIGAPLESPTAPGRNRRLLFKASGAVALGMAFATAHWIVPQASRHLSARDLYGRAKALDPNAPIGQYRFNAEGASFYARGHAPTTLSSLDQLLQFLSRSERVFVMAGADELGAIDQKARERRLTYFVIDDSNARFLTLSNRLGTGEKDFNPLRRFITETPPTPQHAVLVNFEDKLELLGYDLATEVRRGEDFKIRFYFKVNQPIGSSYKIFIHFDGPGSRLNGDHVPLAGRFPTRYWVPGYYVIDEHLMKPDRATQPTGTYHIYMGLFAGDQRLKVLSGPQDGENRVRLGTLEVK